MTIQRIIAVTFMSFILPWCVKAESPWKKFQPVFEVEWGYTATVLYDYHYNFLDPEDGFRVDLDDTDVILNTNGHLFFSMMMDINSRMSAGLSTGYIGIKQDRRMIPLCIKERYYFKSNSSDCLFINMIQGISLTKRQDGTRYLAQLGFGYRTMISSSNSIDYSVSLQCSSDHPDYYSSEKHIVVPRKNLLTSDVKYAGINFTIGISF